MPIQPPAIPPIPGTQLSANDLIKSQLRIIGVLASGENPSASEVQDAIVVNNLMLDAWNAERLMVFTITRSVVVSPALKQAYTLGIGGDFNLVRPARVSYVSVISLSNAAQPLELPLEMVDDAGWRNIPVKNISSSLPQKCYDDGGFPFRILSFWPIPSQQVNFVLYSWTPLAQFPDLATKLTFPPGYFEAIRYNGAVRLAPEFNKSVSSDVAALAIESKARIKSVNYQPMIMSVDSALVSDGGQFNWLTGEPVGR